ncbi:TolB family protein [Laceyella putida]|uniref:Prolow-density lipoprotein receptor-related protein 1-like beta-propeller domain-containing protein n=1 Tax=Laceyella putida TaxID=110101 RepID=A0ABW2RKB7_9BACL
MGWFPKGMSGLALVSLAFLTGCSMERLSETEASTTGRQEIATPSGTMTVKDSPRHHVYNEVALRKIMRYEGFHGMDFHSENQLLIRQDNKDYPPIPVEDGEIYPRNLYLYHTVKKEAKLIYGAPEIHCNAQYSPDKRHIYYVQNTEETGTAYIMDHEGKKRVPVSEKGRVHVFSGHWLNNEEVLYATFSGEIYRADLSGKKQLLVKTGKSSIKNTYLINDWVYYTTIDGELVAYNLKTKQTKGLKKNVVWVAPSPDQKWLALVVNEADSHMTLMLTDLQGRSKAKLNEASEIHGVSWSPDQTKLSYILSSQDAKQGLFVTDVRSNRAVQLTADVYHLIAPIKWDAASKNMLLSTVGEKGFVTYVFSLK